MKTIPLTQGQVALVDDEDFLRFGHFKWYARWDEDIQNFYTVRHSPRPEKRTILLHRAIMGEPLGMNVDHKNHDTLDCQRSNLRICTGSQNQMNRNGAQKNSKSGIRGIHFQIKTRKWRAQIKKGRKVKNLGNFDSRSEAAAAYAAANRKRFGEFGGTINRP